MHNKYLSLLLFAMMAMPAMAAEALVEKHALELEQREKFAMPGMWFACAADSDCGLVELDCEGSLAIRQDRISAAEQLIRKKLGSFQGCDGAALPASSAECRQGDCVALFRY